MGKEEDDEAMKLADADRKAVKSVAKARVKAIMRLGQFRVIGV